VWRRANRWGALASVTGAMGTNFALYSMTGQRLDYWDPNVFLAALTVGILALVVVSLATTPEPASRLQNFFARLDTSSDERHEVHQPLLLVNLLTPSRGAEGRGWRAYKEDLVGFTIGWIIVFVLVAGTAWLLAPRTAGLG
jgi:hypothetical protein